MLCREILYLTAKLDEIEETLHQKCREIPYAENLLEIEGIGENILARGARQKWGTSGASMM